MLRADSGDVLCELGTVGCQYLEAVVVPVDEMAKRPEDVIEAE